MLHNKKGIALVVVMAIVMALVILGAAATMIAIGHAGSSYAQIVRARAYYAAEAGLQHALWKCRTGGYNLVTGESESIDITDPKYTLSVDITIEARDANDRNVISAEVAY